MECYSERKGWYVVEDVKELATALSVAQGEIDNVRKTAINPHLKNKYATLASVWDSIREELSKQGLSVIQLPCEAPPGYVGLRTILLHKSGQKIEDRFHMPVRNANNPQEVGSALTYARRYALMALVGVAPEDDDGNQAQGRKEKAPQTTDQTPVDWAMAAADLKAKADLADKDTVKKMFAQVRNSSMPEPGKTELLTYLSTKVK